MYKYRPDVDGLRAVAVTAVVVYHAFPAIVPGGFVGVDVFFVISGYLITRNLLASLDGGTFSLGRFYAGRVRRLFPALALVLASCFAIGWLVLPPLEFVQLGKHMLAGAGFVANFAFWNEAGYFDTEAVKKPLLHLWSLGIEEQFYIVWPVLLWCLWKRRSSILWTIAALSVASFVVNVWLTKSDPVAAFYSPLPRAWELGIGGAITCLESRGWQLSRKTASLASLAGLALIAIAFALIAPESHFPGWWSTLPAIGASLVIAAGPHTSVNRLLGLKAPVAIGLISYPLYLWHWPLISFAWIGLDRAPGTFEMLAIVALSVALAALTYRMLELPIQMHRSSDLRLVGVIIGGLSLVALLGTASWQNGGFALRYPAELRALVTYDYDFQSDARVDECWMDDKVAPDAFAEDCFSSDVMVWGDSHAARLYPGLVEVIEKNVGVAARDGCPPFLSGGYEICQESNAYILSRLETLKPETVILFGYWPRYETVAKGATIPALDDVTQRLMAYGIKNVIVVGPAPVWEDKLPIVMMNYRQDNRPQARLTKGLSNTAFDMEQAMKSHPWPAGVHYASLIEILCNSAGCLTYAPGSAGQLTTWDYGHLTTEGATFVAKSLATGISD